MVDALERVDDMVAFVSPSGEPRWWNRAAAQLLVRSGDGPVPVQEVMVGGLARAAHLVSEVADGDTWVGEQVLLAEDGSRLPVELTVVPRFDGDGGFAGATFLARDLRARHAETAALERRVLHDDLTGVASGAMLGARLDHALTHHRLHGSPTALALVDVDRFAAVNDGLGRTAGDRLLCELAARIGSLTGETDTLARFRGNEFTILVEDRTGLHEIAAFADEVLARLHEPVVLDGGTAFVKASIGVVTVRAGDTMADVLSRVDAAMARARADGGDRVMVDDGGLLLCVDGRSRVPDAVRDAISAGSVAMQFQPVADLDTGHVVFAEALLRIAHPDLGPVSPLDAVATADRLELLPELARAAAQTAVGAAAGWDSSVAVSVNLSAGQVLDERAAEAVAGVVDGAGIDPGRVVVEITEDAYLADPERAAAAVAALADRGMRTALDGFGSGLATLAALRDLGVDMVKLDAGFLAGATGTDRARAVLAAVLAVAEVAGITTVATGIETDEDLTLARSLGCRLGQGHRISRPGAAPVGAWPPVRTGHRDD